MNIIKPVLACAIAVALNLSAVAQADEVKIGFVTTLTTPAAVIGEDMKNAVNLAVSHLGGKMAGKKSR